MFDLGLIIIKADEATKWLPAVRCPQSVVRRRLALSRQFRIPNFEIITQKTFVKEFRNVNKSFWFTLRGIRFRKILSKFSTWQP